MEYSQVLVALHLKLSRRQSHYISISLQCSAPRGYSISHLHPPCSSTLNAPSAFSTSSTPFAPFCIHASLLPSSHCVQQYSKPKTPSPPPYPSHHLLSPPLRTNIPMVLSTYAGKTSMASCVYDILAAFVDDLAKLAAYVGSETKRTQQSKGAHGLHRH